MITVTARVVEAVIAQARRDAPVETCGYLAEKDGIVDTCIPLTNTDKAAEHFTLDPKEQFAAVRSMRQTGHAHRAVYHSHPVTPARPSAEDIRLAYDPGISYVIVSLAEKDPVVKSFRIAKGVAEPEDLQVVTTTGGVQ